MKKKILDTTCGARMLWFDKSNPNAVFADIRSEKHTLCDGRVLEITPDVLMDFRQMDYPDHTFKLVLFDPPHLVHLGKSSWMAKKYGVLGSDWRTDITRGFEECWRVLADDGVLIFKWNERDVSVKELLEIIGREPLFGHTTGRSGKTKWMCFMKLQGNSLRRGGE